MARSIKDIKKEITDYFKDSETIASAYALDSEKSFEEQFSKVSIENILFSIIAVCIWTVEKLFDLHKTEVEDIIDRMKPHSLRWYAEKAKQYQHGYELLPEEDRYPTPSDAEISDIENSRIIAYAAVVEQDKSLRIKVAKASGDDLEPIDQNEMEGFSEYMKRIKDAGVKLQIDSDEADDLRLQLTIYYDPMVINSNGQNLITGKDVVKEAVKNYLQNLPFNGYVVKTYLIDALQRVDGVVIPVINVMQAKYGNLDFTSMDEIYQPDAGYMRIKDENFLETIFIPQSVIE
ncbi:MAG: hypothetical protein LC105_06195 [Chitinophagales bacterium]|nr:hypothetical protein [Chitinophagales bacterium]